MLRMRLANGVITSGQMRVLAEIVQYYGDEANADITTRHIQGSPDWMCQTSPNWSWSYLGSVWRGQCPYITGSPLSGIDPDELIDTQGLC